MYIYIMYTADEDFIEISMDVHFPAQTSSVVVDVELAADDVFPEEDKVFEVYLGASLGVYIHPFAYTSVVIVNDDPPLQGIPYNSLFMRADYVN